MLLTALDKPKDRFICTPHRAHNRIRSPTSAASGPHNKVGEGNRQSRSATSGKGLAIGTRRPCLKIWNARKLLDAAQCRVDPRMVTIDGHEMLFEAFSPVQ